MASKLARRGARYKKPSLSKCLRETDYYFENGMRKVYPYYYVQHNPIKHRWIGKSISEIYNSDKEHRLQTMGYEDDVIKKGSILLNHEKLKSFDVVLRKKDDLKNLIHRHEWPVKDVEIEILEDNEDCLVVNKPCSIPVHPCGAFRHNTLYFILAKELKYKKLHTLNRLDRLTSGVLIFAKNLKTIQKKTLELKSNKIEKEYVCKVIGKFPEHEIRCTKRILVCDDIIGLRVASDDADALPSETIFNLISTNGNTSIVHCRPITGRTHQIRVHLQYLGFPILNDPLYNHWAWGNERFHEGFVTKPPEEIAFGVRRHILKSKMNEVRDQMKTKIEEMSRTNTKSWNEVAIESLESRATYDPTCFSCIQPPEDPKLYEMNMWLHAYKYTGPDWIYTAPLPDWAKLQ